MDKIMMGYMHNPNDDGSNSTTIIKHASILPPGEYELRQGLNECCNPNIGIADCTPYLPDDIVNNLPDNIILTPNLTKPNELDNGSIHHDVQIGVFYCAICGAEMPWYEGQNPNKTRICNECKQAVAWAKEHMKEK
jgi:hypothetical protein